MKRWLSLMAALLVLACSVALAEEAQQVPVAVSVVETADEVTIDPGEIPEYVTALLEVARGEIGYEEGGNNYSKYGEWAGDPNAAWCAEFVCWCVDQVDQNSGTELLNVVYPKYSGQNTGKEWFIKKGRFVFRKGFAPDWGHQWVIDADHDLAKNEYIPYPGDLMFFSYNEAGDTEHVALVEYCTRNSMGEVFVHVIEGNNPSAVQRNSYPLNNSQILGFGLPEDRVDTTIRFGNEGDKVLVLQKKLNRIGILEERHITGVCGSNTRAALQEFQQNWMTDKAATGIADRETMQALELEVLQVEFDDPENWMVTED